MSRTFMQQLGMAPMPTEPKHEHVNVGGNRLTRTVTQGGHVVETQQPGLPTYHRRIGNPYPLFGLALASSFTMLGCLLLNIRGLQSQQIWITMALPLCGGGGITAMMFAFAEGNTWLATACGSLAGIIGGLSLIFLPWANVQASYIETFGVEEGVVELFKALSIVSFCSMVPVFIVFMTSFKTAAPIALATLMLCLTLATGGIAWYEYPNLAVQHAQGGIALAIGVILFINVLSVLLAEEGIRIIPVFPLPRVDE